MAAARRNFDIPQSAPPPVPYACAEDDRHHNEVAGLKVTPCGLANRCLAAYYPKANLLVPLSLHDRQFRTPANMGTAVRVAA